MLPTPPSCAIGPTLSGGHSLLVAAPASVPRMSPTMNPRNPKMLGPLCPISSSPVVKNLKRPAIPHESART